MAGQSRPSHTRSLRKRILNILAELYLLPQSGHAIALAMRDQFPGLDEEGVRDCFSYLEKKGYVEVTRRGGRPLTASVTGAGIDLADGAVSDRGVLPTEPDFSGLAYKREIRARALAYCRQFPDSFNSDDEILDELKQQGIRGALIETVRYHIWYLSLKGYVELKTHPIHRDLIFMARITARGMDLAEGIIADPGVTADG